MRPRVHYGAWVEISHDGRRRRARARDLGAGGIGLELGEAGEAPPPRARVVSEFALPGIALPLEVSGVVAWSETDRCGVRFRDVDSGIAELIESFVAGRL